MKNFDFAHVLVPIYLAVIVLAPMVFIWASWRWWRTELKFELPVWRSYVAFAAFSLGGSSLLMWIFLAIWAKVRGGFRFYDPVLLSFYRWGFLLGLAGFVFSFPGKGNLRWPACFISFAMVVLWFLQASTE